MVHLSYSPDLILYDFYLFPEVKKELRSRRFGLNLEFNNAVIDILNNIGDSQEIVSQKLMTSG